MTESKKIVLGVTGSIAAYKSADIIRGLKDEGFCVSVVMTGTAQRFISPVTLAALSGERVFTELFDSDDRMGHMPHISLAKEASAVLIAPATANIIGKLAHGLADDLLTCITLATKAPVLVAPAMNTAMYHHPAVQDNCTRLRKYQTQLIEPIQGALACGDYGDGHIADVQDIVKAVKAAVSS